MTPVSTYPTVGATILGRRTFLRADATGCVLLRYREQEAQRIAAVPLTGDTLWLLDRGVRAALAPRLAVAARDLGLSAHAALAVADMVRP
jgi:hypothetical protein